MDFSMEPRKEAFAMANPPCGHGWQGQRAPVQAESSPASAADASGASGPSAMPEPPVRRWSHPVDGIDPSQYTNLNRQLHPSLNYIQYALSYQNQMLADIKALLQQIVLDLHERQTEK